MSAKLEQVVVKVEIAAKLEHFKCYILAASVTAHSRK